MKPLSLKTNKDYKIWFISDLHIGHAKDFIIGPRNYSNVIEAYTHTFQMLQEHIGPNDIVFNLGDAVCGAGLNTMEYAKRLVYLPCQKHYFIWGNHNAGMKELYREAKASVGMDMEDMEIYPLTYPNSNFVFLGDYLEMTIDGKHVVLCHYPISSWHNISDEAYMIHGHCHRNLKENITRRLDISWEWKRRPVEWSEINRELRTQKTAVVDHHGVDKFFE
jgi:calcineurin-like phosphoesterase family protein